MTLLQKQPVFATRRQRSLTACAGTHSLLCLRRPFGWAHDRIRYQIVTRCLLGQSVRWGSGKDVVCLCCAVSEERDSSTDHGSKGVQSKAYARPHGCTVDKSRYHVGLSTANRWFPAARCTYFPKPVDAPLGFLLTSTVYIQTHRMRALFSTSRQTAVPSIESLVGGAPSVGPLSKKYLLRPYELVQYMS